MTAIRVVCRGCGQEVNAAEVDRNIRCTVCVAKALIGPSLQEYGRLWAKRQRYRRAGAPHVALEQQLGRLAVRMGRRLHDRIQDGGLAGQVLNDALSLARQKADTAEGRILVPRVGHEFVRTGAKA